MGVGSSSELVYLGKAPWRKDRSLSEEQAGLKGQHGWRCRSGSIGSKTFVEAESGIFRVRVQPSLSAECIGGGSVGQAGKLWERRFFG